MAVAALSSSAIAPAPAAPAAPVASSGTSPVEAREPFAELISRAQPDGKPAQEKSVPEAVEGETANAPVADEAVDAKDTKDGDEPKSDAPVDLLAELEAMAAAASQIMIAVPVPVATAPVVATPIVATPPVDGGATVQVTTITGTSLPTSLALPAAAEPIVTVPTEAPIPVATTTATDNASIPVATTTATDNAPVPVATTTATAMATVPPVLVDSAPASAEAVSQPQVERTAKPAPSNIAAMIAALKTSHQPAEAPPAPAVAAAIAAVAPAISGKASAEPAPVAPTETAAIAPSADTATVTEEAPVVRAEAPAPAATITKPAAPAVRVKTELPELTIAAQPAQDGSLVSNPADAVAADAPLPADAAPADPLPGLADAAALPAVTADTVAPLTAQPAPAAPTSIADAGPIAADGAAQADQSVTRQLDLAQESQWLDRLARDITQAASGHGNLKFQLNPEHLGALSIEVANSAAGTAIRMTADTDQARTIIADAQPRLIAEVRAQGLRVAESHVDLNQQGSNAGSAFAQGQQSQRQSSSEDHKPFSRTPGTVRDDADDSAAREDRELYA